MRRFPLPLLFLIALSVSPAQAGQGQTADSPSQLDFSGSGIVTLGGHTGGSSSAWRPALDFSDTEFQVSGSRRLFDEGAVGSFGLGVLTTDDRRGTAPVLLNQAFVDYQTDRFDAVIGRTDAANARLVDFPTIRGDDLVTLITPTNPFSEGVSPEDHRYSTVASFTLNQGFRFYENIHAQQWIGEGGNRTNGSVGVRLQALAPPGAEFFSRLPSVGIGYEYLDAFARGSRGIHQFQAGAVVNLNTSVIHRWDFRIQDILSVGSPISTFEALNDAFQADSNTLTAAVRYVDSPFGSPATSVALTAGFKNYLHVNASRSLGAALTAARELGQGFDFIAQASSQWRESALARLQAAGVSMEQSLELGMVFHFDASVNRHILPIRSILSLQTQPARGGLHPLSPVREFTVGSEEQGKTLHEARGFGADEPRVKMMNLMMVEGSGFEGMEMEGGSTATEPAPVDSSKITVGGLVLHAELAGGGAKQGQNRLSIKVTRAASGEPASGLSLHARVFMTSMDMGSAEPPIRETAPGVYELKPYFSMAGDWAVEVKLPDSEGGVFRFSVK